MHLHYSKFKQLLKPNKCPSHMNDNVLRQIGQPLLKAWSRSEEMPWKSDVCKIVRLNSNRGKRFPSTNYFLKRIRQLVEENLDDDQYGIAQICRDAGISRTQLHRKIKKYTNTSTSIFIRNLRLQHGKSLLEHTDLNISQVAFSVGFKDSRYFSRLFSEMFHLSPRAYRKQMV